MEAGLFVFYRLRDLSYHHIIYTSYNVSGTVHRNAGFVITLVSLARATGSNVANVARCMVNTTVVPYNCFYYASSGLDHSGLVARMGDFGQLIWPTHLGQLIWLSYLQSFELSSSI